MSKMTNSLNQLWYQKDGDVFNMGLTRNFLESLDECWHILPTNTSRVKEKSPLFTIETNDALLSILSPVAGNFLNWNDRATNFPDKLTEADVIIKLSTKEIVKAEPLAGLDDEVELARLNAIVANTTLPINSRIAANERLHSINRERAEQPHRQAAQLATHPAGTIDWGVGNPFRQATPQPRRTIRQTTVATTPGNPVRPERGILADEFDDNFN